MKAKYLALTLIAAFVVPTADAAQDIDRTLKAGTNPSVEIDNVAGSVTITAWDRQEVKVTGVIDNDKDEFEFTADDKRVVIKVRPERRARHEHDDNDRRHDGARLDIMVPSASSLEVDTVSADVKVDGVRGAQDLGSVSGDIDSVAFDEELELSSISGDVGVRGQGGRADVRLSSVSGKVTARGLKGKVEAESVSGNLDLNADGAARLRLSAVSGDITAATDLAQTTRVDVESVSGTVRLTLKQPVNADFEVETFSGDIDNCFGPKAERASKYAPGRELRFTQGNGSAKVNISTLSGTISFCDR